MKQKIIATIDTEGHKGVSPIDKLIWGITESGRYGIEKIMDEFEKYGIHILFFLDFAEVWDYGEDQIKQVVDCILSRGHDIGVHIHPDHMADKNRLFLWEYSYEEQDEIIRRCTDIYIKLVGKAPISFRAGKYSANCDTLNILCKYGYRYDFSQFYGQKWCGLSPAITINSPVRFKEIVEFPVTMHRSISLFGYKRFDKFDIEGMSSTEIKYALKQITKQDFNVVITFFFHSFSLLEWASDPDHPVLSSKKLKKLRMAIQMAGNNPELEFISEKDLETITPEKENDALKTEIIWDSKIRGLFYSYKKLEYISSRNKKAKLILCALYFSVILLLLSVFGFMLIISH